MLLGLAWSEPLVADLIATVFHPLNERNQVLLTLVNLLHDGKLL